MTIHLRLPTVELVVSEQSATHPSCTYPGCDEQEVRRIRIFLATCCEHTLMQKGWRERSLRRHGGGTTCTLQAIWPACGGVSVIAGVVPAVATVTFSCTTNAGSGDGGVLVTLVNVPVM